MTQLRWLIPNSLLGESIAVMRPHGAKGNEGLALWFGSTDGTHAKVTHLVELTGSGFKTSPLFMSLSSRAMSVLTDLAWEIDCVLIGQIHSHPKRFLDLSNLDKEHGIHSQDYLSVVCPFYAQLNLNSFNECGVHVFENLHYRRIQLGEISERIILCNSELIKIKCEVPV
jgi:proteasome lid subunit RPN8/RPN11